MADKNAKAELNVEDLEGVAGGVSVNVPKDLNDILLGGPDAANPGKKPKPSLKDPRTWSMSEGESNNG